MSHVTTNGSCCEGDSVPQHEECGKPHHEAGHRCVYVRVKHYPERGWIQFLILRILYEKPMHGYQLLEEIESRSQGYHRLMPGAIYTILRRMEANELLRSEWEKVESGPDRRVYRLTDKGVMMLKSGLEAIIRRQKLTEDLVKFYDEKFRGK